MFASTPPPAAIKATQQLSAFGLPYSPVRSILIRPQSRQKEQRRHHADYPRLRREHQLHIVGVSVLVEYSGIIARTDPEQKLPRVRQQLLNIAPHTHRHR